MVAAMLVQLWRRPFDARDEASPVEVPLRVLEIQG